MQQALENTSHDTTNEENLSNKNLDNIENVLEIPLRNDVGVQATEIIPIRKSVKVQANITERKSVRSKMTQTDARFLCSTFLMTNLNC